MENNCRFLGDIVEICYRHKMRYRFADFELDTAALELRQASVPIPVEPQVFALLTLLVENPDRVVGKEEIVEKVWHGRVISDAALSSRIKSVRKALGDDGTEQSIIRTVRGHGYRFVADLVGPALYVGQLPEYTIDVNNQKNPSTEYATGPCIAILPFDVMGGDGEYAVLGDALPAEFISALSGLHWISVIARGSSFRFRGTELDLREIGQALGVSYCLSGALEIFHQRATVTLDLIECVNNSNIWSQRYESAISELHQLRAEICGNLISTLEVQISIREAQRARLSNPETLDAWAAYHLGLQHMYRFNRVDNQKATVMFEQAAQRDPQFARALAGLSFTHFQNAFLRYNSESGRDEALARRYGERAIELEPTDAFCNFALGRSFWLAGDLYSAHGWLERATTLSPSFAQGLYTRGLTDTLAGRGDEGRHGVDAAMRLSPFDPLLYAMRATRAMSDLVGNDVASASHWAEQAARTPGAHVLIAMIATAIHAIANDREQARFWAANVNKQRPDLNRADFFHAFPFTDLKIREQIDAALSEHGF